MTVILFYHLENRPLEQVLPLLLDKTLQRGWRAVVQGATPERIAALSTTLWTWRDDSFLAHGSPASDTDGSDQPIWLCTDDKNPNKAQVKFCIEGVGLPTPDEFDRIVYMFDGNDPQAVETARKHWKSIKDSDHDLTYWRQNEQGRWEKKA